MMQRVWWGLLMGVVLGLAACGQQTVQAPLSDAQVLEDMRALNIDPEAVQAYQSALNNLAQAERLSALAEGDLQLVQTIALGTVARYDSYYAHRTLYPQFDWSRDGCSAPSGLGLGYRETFRPSCNVHDFGYRNYRKFPPIWNDAGRKQVDDNFLANMNRTCAGLSFGSRLTCYPAAYAYYSAVRVAGGSSFF